MEQKIKQEESKRPYKTLDYTIKDIKERNKLVHEIINNTPSERLTPYYLEELANYLVETDQSKKGKQILTDNRMITVNRRETSFEGLIQKFQNGEDGVYNLFSPEGDKNVFLVPKIDKITEQDLEIIPGLRDLVQGIKEIEKQYKEAFGKKKFLLAQQLKEMRQQQYEIKVAYKSPIIFKHIIKTPSKIKVSQDVMINEKGEPVGKGVFSFFDPYHVSCLLCNYSKLKEDSWGNFEDDWWYLMQDFDALSERALKQDYPMLYDIMIYKIDGMQNKDIAAKIKQDYGTTYAVEYLSSLWRKKIPKLIAEKAKQQWLIWHYTFQQKGVWKRCSRCHQVKLAHPYFYTRNKSAKDGWYSMCKCCRNKKKDKEIMVKKK